MTEDNKIMIAICDDDEAQREKLEAYVSEYAKESDVCIQISTFSSGNAYKEQWKKKGEADILLLDIEMPEVDGILLKEFLEEKRSRTKILFTTSHMETMPNAFGANVHGFLQKPIEQEELMRRLKKLCRMIKKEHNVVERNHATGELVFTEEVYWIQSEKQYSKLIMEDGSEFSDKSLTEWEKELEEMGFCRVHKSYLVNFYHVGRIEDEIKMENGGRIPVARRRRKEVKEEYKEFLIREVNI